MPPSRVHISAVQGCYRSVAFHLFITSYLDIMGIKVFSLLSLLLRVEVNCRCAHNRWQWALCTRSIKVERNNINLSKSKTKAFVTQLILSAYLLTSMLIIFSDCWTVAVKLGWVLCITRSNITEFFTDCTSVSACTFEVFFTRKCESCDGNDDENIWSEVQWRLCCLPSCEATSNMLWKNKNAAIGNMEANLTKLSCETNKTA